MTNKKKVLIISLSNLKSDPRVQKQIHVVKQKGYVLDCMGLQPSGDEDTFYKISREGINLQDKIKLATYAFFRSGSRLEKLDFEKHKTVWPSADKQYDLIICNDISSLGFGHKISNSKIPIWADLHEYAPRQMEQSLKWKLLIQPLVIWQTKKYLPKCSYITTVCEGLAMEYTKQFGVRVDDLIYNVPNYEELNPSPPNEKIQIVHHGIATPSRKLELMIDIMEQLGPGYQLHLYLKTGFTDRDEYLQVLKKQSAERNIPVTFHEPVPLNDISKTLNQYDIGLFYLEPVNFNYKNALPNKFFEFLQARLAIVVTPNVEMAKIVKEHDLGEVSKEFRVESMVDAVKKLNKRRIQHCKNQSNSMARRYSSIDTYNKIDGILSRLIQ